MLYAMMRLADLSYKAPGNTNGWANGGESAYLNTATKFAAFDQVLMFGRRSRCLETGLSGHGM